MLSCKLFVEPRSNSNTFLISHSNYPNEFFLIDAGIAKPIINELPAKAEIKGVFLTHGHFDHISGLANLLDVFPTLTLYCHKYTSQLLCDTRLNLSLYLNSPITIKHNFQVNCSEGDSFELFNDCKLIVYHTPGHNTGSLCFGLDNFLFTGDSYIPNLKVVTKLKSGDAIESRKSLKRIKTDLLQLHPLVMPGHSV
jgi:hydroxyacylglutathione hydrolase